MSNSDLRLAFDEDPGNYDRWRPRYCDTLFSKITSFSGLKLIGTVISGFLRFRVKIRFFPRTTN